MCGRNRAKIGKLIFCVRVSTSLEIPGKSLDLKKDKSRLGKFLKICAVS
jgi:hypothetical protein